VLEAYQCETWKERLQGMTIATELYAREAKTNPVPHELTSEQKELLQIQAKWEQETAGASYVDMSVSELLQQAIKEGAVQRAMKLKKQFNIPDKRFWHIEVRTLAQAKAWEELSKLTANKKVPPIGFLPFVEACIEMKNLPEAAKYIARLPEAHEQMEWLCNIGYWKEAAEVAAKEKDADALQVIRQRCKNDQVIRYIDLVLEKLGTHS